MQEERKYCAPYSTHCYHGDNGDDSITTNSGSMFIFDRPLFKKENTFLEFVVFTDTGNGYSVYQRGDTEETKEKLFFEAGGYSRGELSDYMQSLFAILADKGFIAVSDYAGKQAY
jgi:hypothetical protein